MLKTGFHETIGFEKLMRWEVVTFSMIVDIVSNILNHSYSKNSHSFRGVIIIIGIGIIIIIMIEQHNKDLDA